MDGENNGKPYEQMDDLGGPPLFLETSISLFRKSQLNRFICPVAFHQIGSIASLKSCPEDCQCDLGFTPKNCHVNF